MNSIRSRDASGPEGPGASAVFGAFFRKDFTALGAAWLGLTMITLVTASRGEASIAVDASIIIFGAMWLLLDPIEGTNAFWRTRALTAPGMTAAKLGALLLLVLLPVGVVQSWVLLHEDLPRNLLPWLILESLVYVLTLLVITAAVAARCRDLRGFVTFGGIVLVLATSARVGPELLLFRSAWRHRWPLLVGNDLWFLLGSMMLAMTALFLRARRGASTVATASLALALLAVLVVRPLVSAVADAASPFANQAAVVEVRTLEVGDYGPPRPQGLPTLAVRLVRGRADGWTSIADVRFAFEFADGRRRVFDVSAGRQYAYGYDQTPYDLFYPEDMDPAFFDRVRTDGARLEVDLRYRIFLDEPLGTHALRDGARLGPLTRIDRVRRARDGAVSLEVAHVRAPSWRPSDGPELTLFREEPHREIRLANQGEQHYQRLGLLGLPRLTRQRSWYLEAEQRSARPAFTRALSNLDGVRVEAALSRRSALQEASIVIDDFRFEILESPRAHRGGER